MHRMKPFITLREQISERTDAFIKLSKVIPPRSANHTDAHIISQQTMPDSGRVMPGTPSQAQDYGVDLGACNELQGFPNCFRAFHGKSNPATQAVYLVPSIP